ncbi:MAG: hydrogenase assembly protein HypC [Rhodospirillales bacterium 69-11]|jgi:hydrogenase expression/formation protein HypC|nr:HypC/HybG/HupF family hydrogenase formation chaperone [Rhodospirillales bacterium]OJW25184.1 MAG: hydrogenase assembly protein HypC [Rhodospirillales bacterium 69-11]
MCLGVPMEVIAITAGLARCRAKGVERDVSLALLEDQPVAPGDWVLVHVGYAIQTVAAETAASAWALLDRMIAAEDGGDA